MPDAVETFEHIIRHQGPAELVPFLLALDKKDVVPVRLRTLKLEASLYDRKQTDEHKWHGITQTQHLLFFLAGLATFTRKEALVWGSVNLLFLRVSPRWRIEADPAEFINTVLAHSRPEWLTEWLIKTARDNPWVVPTFNEIFGLVTRGLVAADGWLLAQATVHQLRTCGQEAQTARTLATQTKPALNPRQELMLAQLRIAKPLLGAAPEVATFEELVLADFQSYTTLLNRGIPLLFEFDSQVDNSTASAYIHEGSLRLTLSWSEVLLKLAATGHLDRADLLTRCLLALRRDFRRPLLTWFKNLFLALQPTLAERLARQNELLELLPHAQPLVANFALEQLKDLLPEPAFSPAALLPLADSFMARPELKTSLRALIMGLLKRLKQEPAQAPAVAQLLAAALPHPDGTVQERAAKGLAELLNASQPLLNPTETAAVVAIQQATDLLSTPARTVLAPWLDPAALVDVPVPAQAYTPRPGFVPDISAATAIAPVADWHELLFLTGQALQPDQPAEQERWLDGLLRLRAQYPADYASQLRPYLLQVLPYLLKNKTEAEVPEILSSLEYGHYDVEVSLKDMLRPLLISWFGGFARLQMARPRPGFKPDPLLYLTWRRLLAVEARLAPGAVSLPLLSTPTHTPHWVAPTALVEKLLAYEAANQQPDTDDLVLALGRLAWHAPADAATARQQVAKLSHSGLRALLSWLLAPAEAALALLPLPPVSESLVQQVADKLFQGTVAERVAPLAEALPWLWVVTARTRAPLAHLPTLASLVDYPGLAAPWLPQWEISTRTQVYKQPWNKEQPERVETFEELAVSTTDPLLLPSPLLLYSMHAQLPYARQHNMFGMLNSPNFLLSLLPNNPAPLRWHLLRTIFCTSEGYGGNAALLAKQLRALLADGPAYDESASVLLAVGLLYSKPATRALAREVLLAAADTGRLVPVALGNALGRLLAGSYAPVSRLAEALLAIRGIWPATDDALRQLMDALLPELPAAPLRNTAKLLAAYADLRAGQPLPAAVQVRLLEWRTVGSLKQLVNHILS